MPTPIADYDYDLPPERIAQEPATPRDSARLLVVDRDTGLRQHVRVRDILKYLVPGDVLVLNDTRVFPARLAGVRRETSGRIEGLLIEPHGAARWRMMLKSGGKLRVGEKLAFGDKSVDAAIVAKLEADGTYVVDFRGADVLELAAKFGVPPVPPYIRRGRDDRRSRTLDLERYQTVYAKNAGAIAAPTAGLHFTGDLLDRVANAGVEILFVTLHVGLGTFLPIKTDTLEAHPMHAERYAASAGVIERIARAKSQSRRVIAVGTTAVRTLESLSYDPPFADVCGDTDLFVYPPYDFRIVDALMTNFHLPKSTLLALVSAFADRQTIRNAYQDAIDNDYRFYSYGDSMLIL